MNNTKLNPEISVKPSELLELRHKSQEEHRKRIELNRKNTKFEELKPYIENLTKYFEEPKELETYLNIFGADSLLNEAVNFILIEEPYKTSIKENQNLKAFFILSKWSVKQLEIFSKELE